MTKPPDPYSNRATGLWFRTPAGLCQRYEAAPGGGHWYLDSDKQWHAYLESKVKPAKARKEKHG